ncbi:uncharacterized protein LOC113316192 [Papaver somniferum]|uniref:uncharacterized protein LOC113316192 n=1 Tax=Papaver somniferum TaxID=3469 RepID=UPI000E6F9DD3|nr:uncharacterized protein LOC113316192 [Papaver somniferum]
MDDEERSKKEKDEKKKLDTLAKKGAKVGPKKKGGKPAAKPGLEKDGARDKLSELYHLHNPDVICIAELQVFCTIRFVRSLRLVDFCEDVITNEVAGEKGNIWVMWRNYLARPDVLSSSKQAITLNIDGDFVTAVHASFDPVTRRRLWRQLGLGFISIPWLVLGDFNCVLRLYEKKGGRTIKEVYVNEFRSWISDNGLVEADAIGKRYIWSNCGSDNQRIVSKHDRVVVNDAWLYKYQAKLKLETENDILDYDYGNELQFVKVVDAKKSVDDDEIKDYIVNHYQKKFNGGDVNIDPRIFDIEHESITDAECAFMDAIPSLEEVKEAVFDLGAGFAPGPDGFTGYFYRQCWNIISGDLFNAIANCWAMRKISNDINFSFIVFIPKNNKSDAIKDYRPIEKVAFMKGRNIHDNIALASELINEINMERKHGNIGLKLGIAQAFDKISWEFITEVFRQYGFFENWCSWIISILNSSRIFVMINGSPEGFFSISRGLRQDDILIFCRGNLHSLQNLKDMLGMYQRASGQCLSYAKSKFYYGGGTGSRVIVISNYLGMERAFFPDKYLGIQLKPGIVRHIHVRQVVEKIMDKLAVWKGKLLSFQARLVLIRSVISSYVLHFMAVYKWSCTVIKQVERSTRNFLWSGDAEKHKYFTVLYDDLCCSRREGGLGLKKLLDVNRAMLMKLWVSIWDSDKTWARFLRVKDTLDNWCGDFSIAKRLGIFSKGSNDFTAKVSDIIVDGAWAIPLKMRELVIRCNIDLENLPLISGGDDYKIWDLDSKGVFSVKSAKAAIKAPTEILPIAALFSRKVVHPTLSVQYWKIWAKQCCASEDNIIKKTGRSMPTMCRLCRKSCETMNHITWHCRVAKRIWVWTANIFDLQPKEDLVASYKAAKGHSRMIKDLWLVANLEIVTVVE